MGEGGAPRLGARRYRPCRSRVRSRVGALSPVAGCLGRPQSPCAAPERETEALRAGVVVGSLPGVFLGGGGAGPIMQRMWALAPWVRMCAGSGLPSESALPSGSLSSSPLLSVITRRDAEDAVYGRDGYDYDGYRLRVEFPRSGRGTGRGGGGGGGGGAPRGRYGPPSRRSENRVVVSGELTSCGLKFPPRDWFENGKGFCMFVVLF